MRSLLELLRQNGRIWLISGAVAFGLGLVLLVAAFSWNTSPEKHKNEQTGREEDRIGLSSDRRVLSLGIALTILGASFAMIGFVVEQQSARVEKGDRALYSKHLVGLGYALLVIALMNGALLSGMTKTALLHGLNESKPHSGEHSVTTEPGKPLETERSSFAVHPSHPAVVNALLLVLSIGMALMGGLFYIANSLRRKRETNEQFDIGRFWGGLVFRLGEAVVFTLVCFWLIWTYLWENGPCWLPVIGLLLGMFVKSGERLMDGFGRRLFQAAAQFFPLPSTTKEEESDK